MELDNQAIISIGFALTEEDLCVYVKTTEDYFVIIYTLMTFF